MFGIVQGGMFDELRKKCAQELVDVGFGGYAIGGLRYENYDKMIDIVESTTNYLPKQPRIWGRKTC